MGRLLKKKEPGLKKKSKGEDRLSGESESTTDGQASANQTSVAAAKENQQKIAPVKKSTGGGSSLKFNNKYIDQALQFLREVKVELKKVVWPSKKQTIGSTVMVILLVMLVSLFLGIVDVGLSSLIKAVLS